MGDDIWDDPEVRAFREDVERNLVPKIRDSAASLTMWSDEPDVKLAVELGYTLLLGKPLIILKPAGANVPATLARVADAIVEYDDLTDPTVMERVHGELRRIVGD